MSVTEIPATTLAAQQLREAMNAGKVTRATIIEIADATALEPHEVVEIAKRIREEQPPKRIPHPSTVEPVRVSGRQPRVAESAPVPPVKLNVPPAAESETPLTVAREAFAAFQSHPVRAIAGRATKIAVLADELIELVEADVRDSELRAQLAKLEEKAAALRAKLAKPHAKRARKIQRGEFPCPTCGRVFDTKQGITLHATRVHG